MRRNLLRKEEDNDPMSVVSNLFDVGVSPTFCTKVTLR